MLKGKKFDAFALEVCYQLFRLILIYRNIINILLNISCI